MRKKLIAANWKMNKTRAEAAEFARALAEIVKKRENGFDRSEIALFPPFTALEAARKETENSSIILGAQDVFYEEKGSYTGEVSCAMLADAGCEMVIVGHSERRLVLGENDELVAAKTDAALGSGLRVIVCVGETGRERLDGRAEEVVRTQLGAALRGAGHDRVAVAYEPVWAIGTGKNAQTGQIEQMHGHIRKTLSGIFGNGSDGIGILYGGSVNPENAAGIAGAAGVDGMLVGTASLELNSFINIIEKVLKD